MTEIPFTSVRKMFEKSFREHWEVPALSNYQGITLTYGEVAMKIAKIHIGFGKCGLEAGDKVAICSKNQANWAVSFLAAMTYGAVPVPLLHEFKSANIHNLVNHCEAKVLFVDEVVWEGLSENEMPQLRAVVQMSDFRILFGKNNEIRNIGSSINEIFDKKYHGHFTPENVKYKEDKPEELAIINYTSGTSGFSKGVMIPYRAVCSNLQFAGIAEPHLGQTSNLVAMLPSAHMYGMLFEVLHQARTGTHIHFLTRMPTPKVILNAMNEIKPDLVISVPLIIEKIYKSKVKPELEKAGIKFMMKMPLLNLPVKMSIRSSLMNAFGGRFEEIIIGGAAFNKEVEQFLRDVKFPFTVGYGMTECAPIITYAHWDKTKLFSCGPAAPNMEIKIDSPDPINVPGEILVRGANVFLGYYKNEEATRAAFTPDGWFKTGDIGVVDSDGYLFLRGRSKCMILGPSGQNIYPEEIECVLNSRQYVIDSLVIEDNGGLVALVYPDFHQATQDGLSLERLTEIINDDIQENVNKELPNYSRLKSVEILPEDFERTPKRSIKRYLYQRNPD
ncbi:MAG: AMP-binding protein [Bacteroidales bacterium]|nr:AMP-binding protein [Bacteroidales bacterium]